MNAANRVGILIYDSRRETPPLIARQYAHLRGFREELVDLAHGARPSISAAAPRSTIVALSGATADSLEGDVAAEVTALVRHGATMYIRGGFAPGRTVAIKTPIRLSFKISTELAADSYRIGYGTLIPAALENETGQGRFAFKRALGLAEPAEPLAFARGPEGGELPISFAMPCHEGIVICDLQADELAEAALEAPIIERLATTAMRPWETAALIAVERACGRGTKHRVPFDIVLDDRPANFDFFQTGGLERWLSQLETRLSGVHLDFAWIPSQTHPPRSYVATTGRFNVGFVWHGLNRHIDHSELRDPQVELAHGRANVDEIARRYGVRFQPVIIFPYERHSPAVIDAVHRAGFVASFENPFTQPAYETALPGYLRMSTPMQPIYGRYFPIFRRFAARLLDRGRMLALAALGMPIIATVHPQGVGLGRLPGPFQKSGNESDLNRIVSFAAEKKLRPMTLCAIAQEMLA